MKLMVFYDEAGVIISVVQVNPKSRTKPTSLGYSYVTVDQKETGAKSLAEVHAKFRVNADGKLELRPNQRPTTD